MKILKLFLAVFCMNIFFSYTMAQIPQNLTGSKWVSTKKTEKKETQIQLEFVSDNTCVFIVEEKYSNGENYIQPSPYCKFRFSSPEITFLEGKFFDFDMKFYKPVKGHLTEDELQITLDDDSILIFELNR